MILELSEQQEKRLLKWLSESTGHHVDAGLEPPSYSLTFDVLPGFGVQASAACGGRTIDLGDVALQLRAS